MTTNDKEPVTTLADVKDLKKSNAELVAAPTDRVVRDDGANAGVSGIDLARTSDPLCSAENHDHFRMFTSPETLIFQSKSSHKVSFFSGKSSIDSENMRASKGIEQVTGDHSDYGLGHNEQIPIPADMVRDMDVKKPVVAETEYLNLRDEIADLSRLIEEKKARFFAGQQHPDEGPSAPLQSVRAPEGL